MLYFIHRSLFTRLGWTMTMDSVEVFLLLFRCCNLLVTSDSMASFTADSWVSSLFLAPVRKSSSLRTFSVCWPMKHSRTSPS